MEGVTQQQDCLLSIGDNTSALGWIVNLILVSQTVLYKQLLKGQDNIVADSLSRDNYFMNTNTHTLFLKLTVPQQLPVNFKIKPLPKDICSLITSTLQQLSDT